MARYSNTVTNDVGNPLAAAVVTVKPFGADTLATLANDFGAPISNPLPATGSDGAFSFNTTVGYYELYIVVNGHARDPLPIAVGSPNSHEMISVDDFGAVGDGVTNDYAAIVAAQAALVALGGGELLFTLGKTYAIASPIPMQDGITYKGTGSSGIDQVLTTPGAKIYPTGGSAAFINAATTRHAIKFENLFVYSKIGIGGDIFDWSLAGVTAKIEFDGCSFIQENAAKYIIKGTAAGGVFSIWMHDCDYQYQTANTVPPLYFSAFTVNTIVIERTWSTCTTGASSGVPSIHFESTNASGPAINCLVRDMVFELPGGGSVKMLSCTNSGVESSAVYDLGVTPNNPQFEIGKGASGPASNNCWLKGVLSQVGSSAKPDCKIDCSVSGQASFTVDDCTFSYLDGGSATPTPGILVIGGNITNLQNIAYTRLGASGAGDITFGTTDASSKSYTIWNGYAGNNQGYLNFYQSGAYKGAINPSGGFQWGGTLLAPGFSIDSTGLLSTKAAIYPATPGGATQSAASIYAGSGAPSNSDGANGDYYFRSNGTAGANTLIYHKEAGSWVALITT